jgi:hypothetical protein
MEWWKVLYLVVAIIYIVAGAACMYANRAECTADDWYAATGILLARLGLCFGLIWYADELAEGLIGAKFGMISEASPGWAVAFMGWVFLLLPEIVDLVRWIAAER